ncbi:MAG: hypothetical protein JNK82_07345 [Myxococcaceae bacterium]|nr:hypothetical protein [Myxococcaceae bacterium]
MRAQPVAGEGLLHPAALAAAALLGLNDHLFKALWPGTVTGKLSDVAGLLVFPLLLQALWELGGWRSGRRVAPSLNVLAVCVLVTAVVFTLAKVWPPGSHAYRVAFGVARWPLDAALATLSGRGLPPLSRVSLTPDATDLVALPAAALALWVGAARVRASGRCASGRCAPVSAPEARSFHALGSALANDRRLLRRA